MAREEAEALLRLRHDAEGQLRQQTLKMGRSLEDAHASLDSFVSQQQTRRARELASRQKQLAGWDGQLQKLTKLLELAAANDGGAKGAAARASLAVADRDARGFGGARDSTPPFGAGSRRNLFGVSPQAERGPGSAAMGGVWSGDRGSDASPGSMHSGGFFGGVFGGSPQQVARHGGSGGGGGPSGDRGGADAFVDGAATLRGLIETLSSTMRAALDEHTGALNALDARRREMDSLEREAYEMRLEQVMPPPCSSSLGPRTLHPPLALALCIRPWPSHFASSLGPRTLHRPLALPRLSSSPPLPPHPPLACSSRFKGSCAHCRTCVST